MLQSWLLKLWLLFWVSLEEEEERKGMIPVQPLVM
jgi:hypothetical protein